jgi:hypothetical protein
MKKSKWILWEEVGDTGLRIIRQTHRDTDFGIDGDNMFSVPDKSRCLASYYLPEVGRSIVFVQGDDKNMDGNILAFPTKEERDECIEMFLAYNWYWNHASPQEETPNVPVPPPPAGSQGILKEK